MEFSSGMLVRLVDDEATTYQLVSVEEDGGRCWLRRSPQTRVAPAAFPVAASRIKTIS